MRDINKLFSIIFVIMVSVGISLNSVFATQNSDETLQNIIGAMDMSLVNGITWSGGVKVNNCVVYELNNSNELTGVSMKPNIASANVLTTLPYRHGLVHLQTGAYNMSSSSSLADDFNYSNIAIIKITPHNDCNFLGYITNVGIWTSKNYATVDAYACMRSANVIYVLYALRQGDYSTGLQFNIEMTYNVNDSNQVNPTLKFGLANLLIDVGSSSYIGSTYSIMYLLNRLVYIQEHGGSADISSLTADFDELLLLMNDIKVNSVSITDKCNSLISKCDLIINHLEKIENGLYDSTDDKSWLSKIYDKLVNGDSSSESSSRVDKTVEQLETLDNAVDTELINNNVDTHINTVNIDNIVAPDMIDSFYWLRDYNQDIFTSLKGTENGNGFTVLYSVPIVILLLCLLI